jgi:hypothetical protein
MKPFTTIVIIALLTQLCNCALTKVATVPLRVSGAVISAVPVVGNTADKVIDGTADIIDR